MQPISKTQVDDDMREWFATLKRDVPSGLPSKAEIQTEVVHLTQEQSAAFRDNPRDFIHQYSSGNAANAVVDPLYG